MNTSCTNHPLYGQVAPQWFKLSYMDVRSFVALLCACCCCVTVWDGGDEQEYLEDTKEQDVRFEVYFYYGSRNN
jgi:hypothetical protein